MDVTVAKKVYRYEFSSEITNELSIFSKMHQYDDRKTFKEAWEKWYEINDQFLTNEETRMVTLGYTGDVKDKMFKSARYYFRKKSTEKKEPKQRREYISLSKELLDLMDTHIEMMIMARNSKPSDGFCDFIETNHKIIEDEITILKENLREIEKINHKIKKTYKNRYFIFNVKNN